MALAQERTTGQGGSARGTDDPDALVVEVVRRHADRALGIARRITGSHDDALEAYSRALVKLVDHKTSIRPPTAAAWLFQVVRNEALDVRAARARLVTLEPELLDPLLGPASADVFERVEERDLHGRAAQALSSLKPDEIKALTLRAAGLSYAEIATRESWSATKTHRMISEGRTAFRKALTELETGQACHRWHPVIVGTRDVSTRDRARLRVHLRSCAGCRATARAVVEGDAALRVLLPVGVVAASPGPSRWTGWLDVLADRFGGMAVKVQTSGEAVIASKLSVVAASAVAVGGGAVAVQHAARPEDRAPAVRQVATVTQRAASPRPTAPAAARQPAAVGSATTTTAQLPSASRTSTASTRATSRTTDFQRPGSSFESGSRSSRVEFGGTARRRIKAKSKPKPRARSQQRSVAPTHTSSDFSVAPAAPTTTSSSNASSGEFSGATPAARSTSSEFGG